VITKYQNILAWALGIGIVSFAFRNYFYQGIMIGLSLCVVVLFIIFVIVFNDKSRPKNVLGSKLVWIPLLVISLSIVVSGFARYLVDKNTVTLLDRATIAVVFFGVYLACRMFGEKVLKPFAIAVVIETASLILYSLILYRVHNGGFVSVHDYNMAVGLLLIGGIVSVWKKQYLIVTIALIGIFLTGAEEGILATAIIFLAIIIRRDFSKKILFPIGAVVIVVLLGLVPFNYTRTIYATTIDKTSELFTGKHAEQSVIVAEDKKNHTDIFVPSQYNTLLDFALNGRLAFDKIAIQKWNWLGSGYVMNPVDLTDYPIYNVPMVIAEQIGILGALAWLFVTFFCLVKTKWKYAFIAVLALGLLDNFMWCEWGVVWFCLVGVSTISTRKSDLMFKEVK
jgi:hypothetical protein